MLVGLYVPPGLGTPRALLGRLGGGGLGGGHLGYLAKPAAVTV